MSLSTIIATENETGYLIAAPGLVWADVWGHSGQGGFEGQFSYELYSKIGSSPANYELARGRLMFDTSGLHTPVITATLRIIFKQLIQESGTSYIHFVGGEGLGDNMVASDFGALRLNTSNISDFKYSVGIPGETYLDFPLNDYGLSLIDTDGYTKFGMRFESDVNNIAPESGISQVWISWYGGLYSSGPSGFEAQLVVNDSAKTTLEDRVTRVRHLVDKENYLSELSIGGLDNRWHIPGQEAGTRELVYIMNTMTGELELYWVYSDGRPSEKYVPPGTQATQGTATQTPPPFKWTPPWPAPSETQPPYKWTPPTIDNIDDLTTK